MDAAVSLFLSILKAATLSVGGLSSLPLMRAELVTTGHVTVAQLIEALAIGRLSTGPSGLYVVSLGYFALGWLGALVALVAATLPPLTMVVAAQHVRRYLLTAWAAGIVRGVALSASGLTFATGLSLFTQGREPLAIPPWQAAIAVASAAITIPGKIHPGIIVLVAAAIGIVLR